MYTHLLLYYFTGTGNSYRVACWMAEAACQRGISAQVSSIEAAQASTYPADPGHLIGLVGPTHGFTAPWWLIRFALCLPRGRGAHAFTLFNRAGYKVGQVIFPGLEGTAAYLIALILWIKGYRVRGATGLDMPSNWTVIHPGFGPADSAAIIARAKPRALAFLERILDGESAFRGLFPLFLGLLLAPISLAYLLMGRFFLAKLFYASSKCNGCGLCARSCPVGAIRMQGKANPRPYWTLLCESCTRCFNYCPHNAVEASYPFGALAFYLANIPVAALLLDSLARWASAAAGLKGGLVEWLIAYPYKLLAIVVAYALFSLLLRIPLLNRLLTLATPTHYYRRYHEPATTLGDLSRSEVTRHGKGS